MTIALIIALGLAALYVLAPYMAQEARLRLRRVVLAASAIASLLAIAFGTWAYHDSAKHLRLSDFMSAEQATPTVGPWTKYQAAAASKYTIVPRFDPSKPFTTAPAANAKTTYIDVISADGVWHKFPEGTPEAVIDRMRKAYALGYTATEKEALENPK